MNKRYFDALMADRRLSLRALATRMGMSHSQLSLTFSGARKLQLDEAAQLSQIFSEPISRIIENAGVSVRPMAGRRCDVIGSLRGDGTIQPTPGDRSERTHTPDDLPDDTQALQARTGESVLSWMDGWVYFVRPPREPSAETIGRTCYAKIKDGPAVIATVRRGYRDGTFNLVGPFDAESVSLDWASPVLSVRT